MFTDLNQLIPGYNVPQLNEVVNAFGLSWGRLDQIRLLPFVVDGSARDAGNTGFTTVLRPGLLMGRVDTGAASTLLKLKQWDPTATDGTNKIAAVLWQPINMQVLGTNYDRFVGYACVGGPVVAKSLCVASAATQGIAGVASEYLIRSQMYPNFQMSDDPAGYKAEGGTFLTTIAATATITTALAGAHFVVSGAVAAVTLTLPATPLAGLTYTVTNASNQNLTITAGTADTMIVLNDLQADSIALSTASELIGGTFKIIGTGTAWLVIPHLWEAQTVTVAT